MGRKGNGNGKESKSGSDAVEVEKLTLKVGKNEGNSSKSDSPPTPNLTKSFHFVEKESHNSSGQTTENIDIPKDQASAENITMISEEGQPKVVENPIIAEPEKDSQFPSEYQPSNQDPKENLQKTDDFESVIKPKTDDLMKCPEVCIEGKNVDENKIESKFSEQPQVEENVTLQLNSKFEHKLSAAVDNLMDNKIRKAKKFLSRRRALSETAPDDFLPNITDSEAMILCLLAKNDKTVHRQLEFKNVNKTLKFGELLERTTIPEDNGILTIYEFWTIILFSFAIIGFLIYLMISNFKSQIAIASASFFGGYLYGDYKGSHDHQNESQIVPTTTALPPVVTENTPNLSTLESCAVLFSFEPYVRRSCFAQFAEIPIDSLISNYAFIFWAIVLLEEVLIVCYWIIKWWKGRRQTEERVARNHEPNGPRPVVPKPHPSQIPGYRRRSSLQEPGLPPIQESGGGQPTKVSSPFLDKPVVQKLAEHYKIPDPFEVARHTLESKNKTSSNGTNSTINSTFGKAGTLKVESLSDTSSKLSSTDSILDPAEEIPGSIKILNPPLPKPLIKPNISEIDIPPLSKPNVPPDPPGNPQTFTVVVLGETGVGKSTLICSLANYAKWPKFEVAKDNFNNLEVCIPVRFDVQYRDGRPTETVSVGEEFNENENFNIQGHSVTQMPKVHECTFGRNRLRIIDTPGLNDTRGMEQDQENLKLIKEIIHNQQEIHAIILVIKSNESKIRPEFELSARNLLSIFPKSAINNLFFFFTHSIGTFFAIGDVMNPLTEFSRKFKETHSVSLALTPDRTFCVDSESFRYLLAKHEGITYINREEKEFNFSWNESASSITQFINVIEGITPIKNEEIVSANEFVKEAIKFCDSYENNGLNLSDDEKPEFNSNLADFLKSVLNKAMPIEAPKLKRILALLNCGSVLNDNDEIRKRIKKLAKRAF